jgi:hypothetical protein
LPGWVEESSVKLRDQLVPPEALVALSTCMSLLSCRLS